MRIPRGTARIARIKIMISGLLTWMKVRITLTIKGQQLCSALIRRRGGSQGKGLRVLVENNKFVLNSSIYHSYNLFL
jgi:hypothetical protein